MREIPVNFRGMNKINPIGHKYGMLTVVSEHSKTRNGHLRYVCTCECGNECAVLLTHLRQESTKSCGCLNKKLGKDHKDWNGVGEISGAFWYDHIVRSANGEKGKRRKLEVSIDKVFAWDLFLRQERRCALTGRILTFPAYHKDKSWNASLDRIDSSKGYKKGNVQWVHKDVNIMKNKYDNRYFIQTALEIAMHMAGGSCET